MIARKKNNNTRRLKKRTSQIVKKRNLSQLQFMVKEVLFLQILFPMNISKMSSIFLKEIRVKKMSYF